MIEQAHCAEAAHCQPHGMDEANQLLARVIRGFYVLAALELVAFFAYVVVFDEDIIGILNPALTIVFAEFLARRRSRTLALTSLGFGVFGVLSLPLEAMGFMDPDKTPWWTDAINGTASVVLGALAAIACFRWHAAARTAIVWKNVVVVSLLTVAYSVVALLVMLIVHVIVLGDQDSEAAMEAIVVIWIGLIIASLAGAFPGTRRRPWAVP